MITQLSSNLIAVEIPIDATHVNIDDGDLCYFINKTDVEQVMELPEGNYERLGEWIKEDGLSIYRPLGNTDICPIDSLYLKQKGCILTPENKFVILKNK